MGEVDTKPIESVQSALSLFGEKNDHRKFRSTGSEESEKGKELGIMLKDLANYKVQLEVKESAYMQAVLKLELYQKTVDELSVQLKNSEAERNKYIEECREARLLIDELESDIKDISDQLLEAGKDRELLLDAVNKLKATQEELLSTKAELAASMTLAELMETSIGMEQGKTEELLKHITELNEVILLSKLAATEAEKEKSTILSEKEAKIQMATATAVEARDQLEDMEKQMETLDHELLAKSLSIDYFQLELKQAKEVHNSSMIAASDAINDLNRLKLELEMMEKENSNQALSVISMEKEMRHLQLELISAQEEVRQLNCEIEMLTGEMQRVKCETEVIRERESEMQVEIAMLKAELHKDRSKIAAAEASEARARSFKSGLYLAVKQLAIEADEAKKETWRLKQEVEKAEAEEETGNSAPVNPEFVFPSQDLEFPKVEQSKIGVEERRDNSDAQITISLNEYESLIRKAEKADRLAAEDVIASENKCELDAVKKELEVAMAEIWELRYVAEQAASKAELAEKAKAAIEGQLRMWREHKQKRRAALDALREESASEVSNPPKYKKAPPTPYLPLGKVLNMKF